jgi:tight adherence protein B
MIPVPLLGAFLALIFTAGVLMVIFGLTPRPVSTIAQAEKSERSRPARSSMDVRTFQLLLFGSMFAVVGVAVTGWIAAGVLVGALSWAVPYTVKTRRAFIESNERMRALADWIETVRDLIGAARGIEMALITSAETVPDALRPDVELLAAAVRVGRVRDALVSFGERIGDPVCDQVMWALAIATENPSGSISEVLSQAAGTCRESLSTRQHIGGERQKSRTVVNAMLVMIAVLSIAGFNLQPKFRDWYGAPFGQLILCVLITMFVGGYGLLQVMNRFDTGIRLPLTRDAASSSSPGFSSSSFSLLEVES